MAERRTLTVKLGRHTLTVPPTPWPIVADILGVDDLTQLLGGGGDPLAVLSTRFHDRPTMDLHGVLAEFIPDLPDKIALHEWGGYASEDDMRAGRRDRESAKDAPDVQQIADTVKAILMVNGGGTVGELLGLVRDVQGLTGQGESNGQGSLPASATSPGASGE